MLLVPRAKVPGSSSSSHAWRAEDATSSSQGRLRERGGRGKEEVRKGEGEERKGEGEFQLWLQAICPNGDGELYHHKVVLSCTVATSRKLCDQLYCHSVSSLVSDPGHTHPDNMTTLWLLPAQGCEIKSGQVRPGIGRRTVYH